MIQQGSILKGFKDNFIEINKVKDYSLEIKDFDWTRKDDKGQYLKAFLEHYIFEIIFKRKSPKSKNSPYKRIICSNNLLFLSKLYKGLGEKTPIKGKITKSTKNVDNSKFIVFDVLDKDFKTINLYDWVILDTYRFNNEEQDLPPVLQFFVNQLKTPFEKKVDKFENKQNKRL